MRLTRNYDKVIVNKQVLNHMRLNCLKIYFEMLKDIRSNLG